VEVARVDRESAIEIGTRGVEIELRLGGFAGGNQRTDRSRVGGHGTFGRPLSLGGPVLPQLDRGQQHERTQGRRISGEHRVDLLPRPGDVTAVEGDGRQLRTALRLEGRLGERRLQDRARAFAVAVR
jgi:hypothetical protein